MHTLDIIVPENGQMLTLVKLERDHALIWAVAPPVRLHWNTICAAIRGTIVRFTEKRAVLRFPDGQPRCRKLSRYNLFFAGWCAHCERPAYTEGDRMVCYRCERLCTELPPAHIFPATLRPDSLNIAREFRLMAERGCTRNQAQAMLRPIFRRAA
jgi:hypothetical protein